ncbi:MAG: DNA polymerase III subunit chi [Pseudomonadota bacterium]
MTRIEFLLLPDDSADEASFHHANNLAKRAIDGGGLFIYTSCSETTRRLDSYLQPNLTETHDALPPVSLASAPSAFACLAESPVLVCNDREPDGSHHTLLNLCDDVPWFFSRFERLIELVRGDENARKMGRERYRYYKVRGYPLSHRHVSAH